MFYQDNISKPFYFSADRSDVAIRHLGCPTNHRELKCENINVCRVPKNAKYNHTPAAILNWDLTSAGNKGLNVWRNGVRDYL